MGPEEEPEPEQQDNDDDGNKDEVDAEPEPEKENEPEPEAQDEPEPEQQDNDDEHDTNIISPHEIAKKMMESQGIPEAQFQFHLNSLGKVTYWIVNSMGKAFGDIEVPGEGFKLIRA